MDARAHVYIAGASPAGQPHLRYQLEGIQASLSGKNGEDLEAVNYAMEYETNGHSGSGYERTIIYACMHARCSL